MQWHMYNVITITRRNNVCDNSLYLYYAAVCLCHKIVTIMFHNLCSLKLRFMCCYHYHIDHCWPLSL